MKKRIIFDMDNTIMDFPTDYASIYSLFCIKYNLKVTPERLYEVFGKYETLKYDKYYKKEKLIELFNNEFNTNLDISAVDYFNEIYSNLISKIDDEVIDTLKYLKKKYELVILTNWFTDSQKQRLKNANALEYFDEFYGGDIVPMKPYKESFLTACGNKELKECIMIGDNLKVDIEGAKAVDIDTILIDKKNKYPDYKGVKINKFCELKEML